MEDEILSDFAEAWCQELIKSSKYKILEFDNRCAPNQPTNNRVVTNTLFSKAWKTDTIVRALLGLESKETQPPHITKETIMLYSLGTDLGGYRNIAHGGALLALLDQTMGNCAVNNYGLTAMTLNVSVDFKKGFKLPGVALTRAVATRRNGKRVNTKGTFEDGRGNIYLEATAVFYVRWPGSL